MSIHKGEKMIVSFIPNLVCFTSTRVFTAPALAPAKPANLKKLNGLLLLNDIQEVNPRVSHRTKTHAVKTPGGRQIISPKQLSPGLLLITQA